MKAGLSHNIVDVWHLSFNAEISYDTSILSADEHQRAERFKQPIHRQRWRFFRYGLRHVLSLYVETSPKEISFGYTDKGKPFLTTTTTPQRFFNLSHSGNRAVIAVSSLCEVGIDIELEKTVREIDDVARRFFSPCEQQEFFALPAESKLSAFYRIWTQKEAVIKATGQGISAPLHQFDVAVSNAHRWQQVNVREEMQSKAPLYVNTLPSRAKVQVAIALKPKDAIDVDEIKIAKKDFDL